MKYQVPFRVIVSCPLPGVAMRVQKGRDELLDPSRLPDGSAAFDFDLTVDDGSGTLNFLGQYAQGPKNARFVYVNSGTYAGQAGTIWARRAKLSLMSITREQISEALAQPGSHIEVTMPGIGKDGGPTCASVKGIEWKVVRK